MCTGVFVWSARVERVGCAFTRVFVRRVRLGVFAFMRAHWYCRAHLRGHNKNEG